MQLRRKGGDSCGSKSSNSSLLSVLHEFWDSWISDIELRQRRLASSKKVSTADSLEKKLEADAKKNEERKERVRTRMILLDKSTKKNNFFSGCSEKSLPASSSNVSSITSFTPQDRSDAPAASSIHLSSEDERLSSTVEFSMNPSTTETQSSSNDMSQKISSIEDSRNNFTKDRYQTFFPPLNLEKLQGLSHPTRPTFMAPFSNAAGMPFDRSDMIESMSTISFTDSEITSTSRTVSFLVYFH